MKEIRITADLWHLTPDWAVAGMRGSFGMTRMTFDLSPDWDRLGKRVTFFPADGSRAVAVIMVGDSVIIPNEVMACAGTASFVLDGIGASDETLISRQGELRIIDTAEPGGDETIEHTPAEFDQLRAAVEVLRVEIIKLKKERG